MGTLPEAPCAGRGPGEGRLRCRGLHRIPERVSAECLGAPSPWSRASWLRGRGRVAFTFDSARVSAMSRHPFDHVAGRAVGRDTPRQDLVCGGFDPRFSPGGPPQESRSPSRTAWRIRARARSRRAPFRLLGALGQARCSGSRRASPRCPSSLGRDGAHDGRHEPALRPERERRAKGGLHRVGPAWSALFRTSTSAISMRPAFRVWIASPDSGVSTTIVVSAVSATSSSDCPTPTVSMSVVWLPQASSSSASSPGGPRGRPGCPASPCSG